MPLDQLTNEELDKMHEKDLQESEMSFLDHLEILRWHLIRALIAVTLLTMVAFYFGKWIFQNIIFAPKKPDFWTYRQLCSLGKWLQIDGLCVQTVNFKIQSTALTGQFMMYISACLVMGLILAFPYIFWEIWRFIKPGLYRKEQKAAQGAVFYVSILFMLGVLFGYFLVAPLSINFLANFQIDPTEVNNDINIVNYVSLLTTLVLACALMFQLPVLVFFLAKIGILTPKFMRTYRRHSIILILILVGIITPTPDIISQLLIASPLVVLYELSIMIAARVEKANRLEMSKLEE
ncbi:MAG: twin-arginine translocase subunit TatC [Microscillaceae bacterium]|jgi:sec-independent protein translocase protein TatC|nr:twin-arginine translocase subunit TatC [Microscillaceae bacterium]